MDTRFETEEQQLEALKRWWGENGRAVLWGLFIGLAVLVGSRLWYQHVQQQAVAASMEFDQLRQELSAERLDAVAQRAAYIREHFAKTPYAVMAALVQARIAVEKGQLAAAADHLRWVLDNEPLPEYADAARLRLARVLFALGQADQALARLDPAPSTLQARYQELRGDILLGKGDREAARAAYTRAQALLPADADKTILRMKLTDLGKPAA